YLIESYQFLRGVEARLRLMNTTARHDLPSGGELDRLAYLLKIPAAKLSEKVDEYRRLNRELFDQIFDGNYSPG
ncbi:MAG: hypothetical protein AAGA30_08410, partial [Planctomycetota bacterium]